MIDSNEVERRRFKRAKVNFIVVYQVEEPIALRMKMGVDKEIFAIMLDLGEDGMSLLTNYDIPPEATLSTKFTLIDSSGLSKEFIKIDALGRIVYNLPLERFEHRLGIQFIRIEKEDRLKIHNFVEISLLGKN